MESNNSLTLNDVPNINSGLIKNYSNIKSCIYTIYDCANALNIEAMQDYISPEYCQEKIRIIEHDLECLKHRLGLTQNEASDLPKAEVELGNMIFNSNVNQYYQCPEYITSLLMGIEAKLRVKYWNKHQQEIDSPFDNTSSRYENDTFQVEAYNWNDEYEQPYNFKWKNIEISWYKYLGRDMTINQKITPQQAVEMFDDCIKSLDNF